MGAEALWRARVRGGFRICRDVSECHSFGLPCGDTKALNASWASRRPAEQRGRVRAPGGCSMRVAAVLLCSLLLGAVLLSTTAASEGSDAPEERGIVRFSLGSDTAYRFRAPVRMEFSLENLTDDNLWVLKWHTPFEGVSNRIFDVTCDGREAPYKGVMLKRGSPAETDYLMLAPHDKKTCAFDLASVYTLPASGECRVRFEGRLLDVSRSAPKIMEGAEQSWKPMTIRGNDVTFRSIGE